MSNFFTTNHEKAPLDPFMAEAIYKRLNTVGGADAVSAKNPRFIGVQYSFADKVDARAANAGLESPESLQVSEAAALEAESVGLQSGVAESRPVVALENDRLSDIRKQIAAARGDDYELAA